MRKRIRNYHIGRLSLSYLKPDLVVNTNNPSTDTQAQKFAMLPTSNFIVRGLQSCYSKPIDLLNIVDRN